MLEAAQTVVGLLTQRQVPASFYALNGYVAVQLLAEAIANAGREDFRQTGEWLKKNSVPTILGPLQFEDDGDVASTPIGLYGWQDHILVLLDASITAQCTSGDPTWKQ